MNGYKPRRDYWNDFIYFGYKELVEATGLRVLEARYRYYILDDPTLADWEYDLLERSYESMAATVGLPSLIKDMVGYNQNNPLHNEVLEIVKIC